MRPLLLSAFGLLACHGATAQTKAPAPVSQWGWGVRAGVGRASSQHGDGRREYDESSVEPVVGFVATRYFARPLVSLGLQALLTRNTLTVDYQQTPVLPAYGPQTLHQWKLFTPVYVRTSSPATGFHLLAGAGPTFALGRPGGTAAYYVRPIELTGLVGAEVRLMPWHRYETTLGFQVHVPLTSSYSYGYPNIYTTNLGVRVEQEARQDVSSTWVGFTLGTTLYPASGR